MLQVTKLSIPPPSVKVSIQLLLDVEAFIFNELPTILNIDAELIKKNYLISIEEPNIESKYKSIKEYPYQLLPEKTIKVSQGFGISYYELKNNNSYDVHLYYGKNKLYSEIRINISEELPSASVETIKSKLLQILNHYKTLNFIFHPPAAVMPGIISLLFIIGFLQYKHIYSNLPLDNFIFIVVMAISYNIKPYSLFDTQKNNTRESIVNWVILLILSAFILFLLKKILASNKVFEAQLPFYASRTGHSRRIDSRIFAFEKLFEIFNFLILHLKLTMNFICNLLTVHAMYMAQTLADLIIIVND